MSVSTPAPREGRGLDLLALMLLVIGLLMAAYGLFGLRALTTGPIHTAPGELAVARAEHFDRLARTGAAVIGAAILVAIASTARRVVRARRQRQQSP